MKKILAAVMACLLMMGFTVIPAFAEGSLPADTDVGYRDVTGDSPESTDIPVYGYIGEDVDVTDPDPDDPDTPPDFTPFEINVSVPVKIIWVAFESDAGAISAPNYKITNNSVGNNVAVAITSFTGTATNPDNATVDPDLILNLTGAPMARNVVNGDGITATYLTTAATVGTLSARGSYTFSLGGTWDGGFAVALMPTYEMVLTFTLAP